MSNVDRCFCSSEYVTGNYQELDFAWEVYTPVTLLRT
jgi:hypothetical protein